MLILFSFGYFNDHLPSKDLVTQFALFVFRKRLSFCVCASFRVLFLVGCGI